jgi:5'-nucleotidase
MQVLITNDDGIAAPGLRWLARAAHDQGWSVMVAAPEAEASGTSAALTAVVDQGRIIITRTSLPGLPDIPAYSVAASPSYISVLGGLGAFGAKPDLVLSGINRGANAGQAILHSGTCGAALTAANHGARAMAVSLDVLTAARASGASGGNAIAAIDTVDDEARHWDTAAGLARQLLPWLMNAPPGTMLNVNVPDCAPADLRGLQQASLASFGQVQMAIAEKGSSYVRVAIEQHRGTLEPGTDTALLAEGFATATPVQAIHHVTGVTLPSVVLGEPDPRT